MDFENTIKGTTAGEYKEAYLDIVHYMANGCYNGENSLPVKTLETSMVALFNANKYGWHDLVKNPNDLPEHTGYFLVKTNSGKYEVTFRDVNKGWFSMFQPAPKKIAWRKIEPFEE